MANANNADETAIRQMLDRLDTAYGERDSDSFLACFADDIVAMPPDREPIVGIDAWRAMITGMFERTTVSQTKLSVEEVVIAGDWAFERHFDSAVYTPTAGGEARHVFFKGMWVMRRQPDNNWKIARYVWNVNPAPSGT